MESDGGVALLFQVRTWRDWAPMIWNGRGVDVPCGWLALMQYGVQERLQFKVLWFPEGGEKHLETFYSENGVTAYGYRIVHSVLSTALV